LFSNIQLQHQTARTDNSHAVKCSVITCFGSHSAANKWCTGCCANCIGPRIILS